jgi:hypothetical protein
MLVVVRNEEPGHDEGAHPMDARDRPSIGRVVIRPGVAGG